MPIAVPSEVELAWKAADVAQYFEADPDEASRTVRLRDGSTQVIPAEMFGPVMYDCDAAKIAVADSYLTSMGRVFDEHGAVDKWLLRGDLVQWWREDIGMRAALRRNLGEKGILLYIHTLHEMRRESALGHRATELWYTARFGVSERGGPPRTLVSVWDNGKPYLSAKAIQKSWMRPDSWHDALSSVVTPAVINMFRGKLTIVSGGNRVDVSLWGVNESGVDDTGGNLMLVDVPHIPPRAKGPHARGRADNVLRGYDLDWMNQRKPEPRREQLGPIPTPYEL